MSRRLWIPVVGVLALALLAAGGGAYVYFFSGLRTTPPTLALASPSPTPATDASPTATTGGAGTWTIGTGSLAGYRVKEQFVGQTSSHEAVARTSAVTGQVTITHSGDTYQLSAAKITVQLSNLASVDSVAGYNVTNRDRIVRQSLDVSSFPTALFEAQSVTLPAAAAAGQAVAVSVPGKLTIHGVTKDVTASLQLRVTGSTAQIAGSISTNMTDFGVNPPTIGFTTVESAAQIEVSLNLARSA
jgi:polyisoprenoid-binding protein YceI